LSLVVVFTGCKNHYLIIYDTSIDELDPAILGYDLDNGIIIYNGESTAINKGKLIIDDDVLELKSGVSVRLRAKYSYSRRGKNH